jgi:hypothetical protein
MYLLTQEDLISRKQVEIQSKLNGNTPTGNGHLFDAVIVLTDCT